MKLIESEDETMLRASVQRFLADRHDYLMRQKYITAPLGCDDSLWSDFADLGWLSLPLPEAHGGLGIDASGLNILMECFGRALVVAPYISSVVMSATAVAKLGEAEQCNRILPAIGDGRLRIAFAHREPNNRLGDKEILTEAKRTHSGWLLSGAKSLVLDGGSSHRLLVSARIGDGIGLFDVPADAPNLHINSYRLVDDRCAADILLNGVVVGINALLGDRHDTLPVIEEVLDHGVTAMSADAVGVADVLVESTIEYVNARIQFGKAISSFQAIRHRIADMAVAQEEIRSMAMLAAMRLGAPPVARARAVSAAKAKISTALSMIGRQAIQLHGAMGVTDELPIGAYFKRATAYEMLLGSGDQHLRRYLELAQQSGAGAAFVAA